MPTTFSESKKRYIVSHYIVCVPSNHSMECRWITTARAPLGDLRLEGSLVASAGSDARSLNHFLRTQWDWHEQLPAYTCQLGSCDKRHRHYSGLEPRADAPHGQTPRLNAPYSNAGLLSLLYIMAVGQHTIAATTTTSTLSANPILTTEVTTQVSRQHTHTT